MPFGSGTLQQLSSAGSASIVRDVSNRARLGSDVIDAAVNALFDEHPHMHVAAVGPDGLFVRVPPLVPLTTQTVLRGRTSALELVVPADLTVVVEAWEQAIQTGLGHARVRPLVDRARTASMLFADTRARYGVLLCLIIGPQCAIDADLSGPDGDHARPAVMGCGPRHRTAVRPLDVGPDPDGRLR